jgi:hypothetical protein
MTPTRADHYALARVLADQPLDGHLDATTPEWRDLVERLINLPPEARGGFFATVARLRDDGDQIIKTIADIDPLGPPPAPNPPMRPYATLEDIANIVSNQPWLWRGWIASGVLNALASDPGVGKTRSALDVARRLWFGLPSPDGQPNDLPPGSRTLWIQGDRNFAEMLQAARDFGLPEHAVVLGSSRDDPVGSLDLDDAPTLAAIGNRVVAAGVSLVVIDTVGMTTSRNLSKPEEAHEFFAPIIELAHKTATPFLGLTHLSVNKEALGRRIVEKARVVMKMTQPDPDGQPNRRRLWVDKTAVQKPSALGVTMKHDGNDYDYDPPREPDPAPRRPGPPPAKLNECKAWLIEQLTPNPAAVKDVRDSAEKAGYSADVLYRAKDAVGADEYVVGRRKWWKLPLAPPANSGRVGDVGVPNSDNSDNSDKPF